MFVIRALLKSCTYDGTTTTLSVNTTTLSVRVDPDETDTIVVDDPDDFTCPRFVWDACNRIEEYASDLVSLPYAWQHELRRQLDAREARSMSVGDSIIVDDPYGFRYVTWDVAPIGFTRSPA